MRRLLSIVYGFFIRRRNRRFDAGEGVRRVSVPVISIGNLSVGGTGKTPLTALVTSIVQQMGLRVAIVSRGYGRSSKGVVVVSDGTTINTDVQNAGDEVWMLARSLSGCIVIASELRLSGAARAIREFGAQCVVLDDGFQHRQLHRDVDIVLVNRETFDRAQVLPEGLLREDISGLGRATIVCRPRDVRESEIRAYTDAAIFEMQTLVRDVVKLRDDEGVSQRGMAILVSGIAHPDRFVATAESLGFSIAEHIVYRDHHPYTTADVEEIVRKALKQQCSIVVCTEKDAVKLRAFLDRFNANSLLVCVVRIESRPVDSSFAPHLRELLRTKIAD